MTLAHLSGTGESRTLGGRAAVVALLLGMLAAGAEARSLSAYLGGSVGGELRGPLATDSESFDVEGSSTSYRLLVGLDLGRHAAVEAGYFRAGGQRMSAALDYGFDLDFDGYSAAALGKLGSERIWAFGKVGAIHWEEEGELITIAGVSQHSQRDEDLLVGAGVTYQPHRHLALRGEWEQFAMDSRSGNERQDQVWLTALVSF